MALAPESKQTLTSRQFSSATEFKRESRLSLPSTRFGNISWEEDKHSLENSTECLAKPSIKLASLSSSEKLMLRNKVPEALKKSEASVLDFRVPPYTL